MTRTSSEDATDRLRHEADAGHFGATMIPQLILLVLTAVGMGFVIAKHGQDRGPFDFWSSAIATAIQLGLLYWGGFFDCFWGTP